MTINTINWQISANDQALIELALIEDLGVNYSDVTSQQLFSGQIKTCSANILSKHPGIITICGIKLAQSLLAKIDPDCKVETSYQDGQQLEQGNNLMTIHGSAQSLLMIERTLLNFLRHLCAVATLTHKFVDKVKDTQLKILDTRKTTPGMRHLEKYAVACGGGVNHRMGLYDAMMIKDTHVDLLGGMEQVFRQLPLIKDNAVPVIVEVRHLQELQQVLTLGRDKISRVLLDNMLPAQLIDCAAMCKQLNIETEASGNITLATIADIAETGVDYASIGMLTHSAGNVDLSMKI